MKIALAGIVKNEFPYLLEWIAHHINIGIDHFIIANHGSTDGTTELLEALEKLGVVTTFFISAETEAPQLAAYKQILEDYGKEYDWIGFLDADEFFIPEKNNSLSEILMSLNEDVGGILFNWAVYGSSFQVFPDCFETPAPVTARFNWRAEQKNKLNNHTKCFIQPKALALDKILYNTPHKLFLKPRWHYVNSDLNRLTNEEDITWGVGRINHYAIKSRWEFANKKMPNGTVAWGNNVHRDWLFFQSLDLNQIFETFPPYLTISRNKIIARLKNELLYIGYQYPKKKKQIEQQELFFKEFKKVEIIKNELVIKGWVIDTNGKSPIAELNFLLKSNSENREPSRIIIKRDKTAKKINPHSSLRSGFELYFSLKGLENEAIIYLIILAQNEELKMIDINLNSLRKNHKHSFFSKIINRLF